MGTKIQANGFFPEFYSATSFDGNTINATRSLYHQNQFVKNSQNRDLIHGYDREKMRQTILTHESIFRNQLQELHRLYGRQRELMNEIERRERNKDDKIMNFFPNIHDPETLRFPTIPLIESTSKDKNHCSLYHRDARSSFKDFGGPEYNADSLGYDSFLKRASVLVDLNITNSVDGNSRGPTFLSRKDVSGFSHRPSKDLFLDSLDGRNGGFSLGKERPCDYTEGRRFDEHSSFRDLCYGMAPAFSRPVLTESRNELLDSTLDMINSASLKKSKIFGVEISEVNANGDKNENGPGKYSKKLDETNPNPTEVLKRNSENSQNFKTIIPQHNLVREINQEIPNGGSPWLLQKIQRSDEPIKMAKNSHFMNLDSLQNGSQEFFKKSEILNGSFQKGINNDIDHLRHHIDLNLSLEDEEIDLEAPVITESEIDASPEAENSKKMKESYQECDRVAAESIIAISSYANKTNSIDSTDDACDLLKWFAETVSSQSHNEEESIPDGMDYFEFMTLKLEETIEPPHEYKPMESNRKGALNKKSRKGHRKDFQRDVLPGLVTLSRHEVTEDLKTFEGEFLKDESLGKRCSGRNGRRLKRPEGTTCKPVYTTLKQQPVCLELGPGEVTLTGWGKRTRRVPRQRCASAHASFTLKC